MTALQKLIRDSGLSVRRFARLILAARNERTLRRWLNNEMPLPDEVEQWAREDVRSLERRGHMLHLTIYAPLNPRKDRHSLTRRQDDD